MKSEQREQNLVSGLFFAKLNAFQFKNFLKARHVDCFFSKHSQKEYSRTSFYTHITKYNYFLYLILLSPATSVFSHFV